MKDIKQILRALRRPTYWISITGKPTLFAPLLNQLEKDLRNKDKIFFVTYFHPDELIENNSPLYSFKNMIDNISILIYIVKYLGAKSKFIKAKDIKDFL